MIAFTHIRQFISTHILFLLGMHILILVQKKKKAHLICHYIFSLCFENVTCYYNDKDVFVHTCITVCVYVFLCSVRILMLNSNQSLCRMSLLSLKLFGHLSWPLDMPRVSMSVCVWLWHFLSGSGAAETLIADYFHSSIRQAAS